MDAGSRTSSACSASSIPRSGALTDHNPIEFLKRLPAEQLERRAAEMALDSRIDYAFRRLAEYLKNTDSWGTVHAAEPAVAAGRLLLGRVRPAREPADLLGRPRASWPATT